MPTAELTRRTTTGATTRGATTPRAGSPRARRIQHAWSRMLLLAATLVLALGGMNVALSGMSWWVVGSIFLAAVLVTTTVVRQVARAAWLPTAAGALVAVLGLTLGFAADTALLGIIPLPDTVGRFSALTTDAWREIAIQSLPATPEVSIVFLLAVSCAGLALIGDLALRAAPALTALPILVLLVVPVAVSAGLADPWWFVFASIGYLVLLRIGRRRSSGPTVVVAGALVVVGSFVVSTIFPPVATPADQGTTYGVATGINPLINLGDDLRRGAPVTAVQYSTSSSKGAYLRLATLDDFDGRAWSPSLIAPTSKNSLAEFPPAVGLTSSIKTTAETASITVGGIRGSWLPVPYPAKKVTGTEGNWFWEPEGLSVRSATSDVGGETYQASYLSVQPDLAQLRSATPEQTNVSQREAASALALPSDLPQIITDTAQQVAGSEATEYDKALALQDYFQSPLFSYSTTAPVRQGYDGTGADVVAEFLQKKSGYCVHFSSAMAIMARVLGIPSRVAVGFQPGDATLKDGKTIFTVSTHDLHAWPELYFSGIGWLRFEPTPGRGVLPDYSVPADVETLPTDTATDSATAAPTAAATPTADAAGDEPTDQPDSATSNANNSFDAAPLTLLLFLAIVLAAGLAPAGARLVIRVRREAAIARGRDPAVNAWAEVRDTARDYGWSAPETETAREFASRLAVVLVAESDVVTGFRDQVESTAYGRQDAAPLSVHQLRALRRAIAESAAPGERVRAFFLPASLLARVRLDARA